MSDKVISKDKIQDFINALIGKYTVVAPVNVDGSPAEFRELKAGDEPVLDGSQMTMTPKEYLLPRYEVLFKANTKRGEVSVETTIPENKPRIMMGMWLPDAQAIRVLDDVFLDHKFKDPYYAARRENTALIATVPAEPRWSWFCNSVDDVESWKKNVDAIMYDLGDRYYVEIINKNASATFDASFFSNPADADIEKKNEVWAKFTGIEKLPFAGKALYDNLAWDDDIWSEIAQKCIGCGICSYNCPSCTCFDIQDETHGNCVSRYRCRDGCQFKDFTLMGAGHNPRQDQVPRSRQRLLHKFQYQHAQFGVVGCTGCGRCVELCPVNVDIRDILTRVCSKERTDSGEQKAES